MKAWNIINYGYTVVPAYLINSILIILVGLSLTELSIYEVAASSVLRAFNSEFTTAWQVNLEGYELPAGKRPVFDAACGAALKVKLVVSRCIYATGPQK